MREEEKREITEINRMTSYEDKYSQKNKIRAVLFVFTNYSKGGMERSFEYLVSALYESGRNIKVYAYILKDISAGDHFPKNVYQLSGISGVRRIRKKYRKLIIINFSSDWRSSGLCFIHFHKYISWINSNPIIMRKARTGMVNFWLLKRSDQIVCICKEQAEIMRIYTKSGKISTIYNCVDIEKVKEESLEYDSNVIRKSILMVARFDLGSKDFFTLIDAYKLLPNEIKSNHKLVLIGNGNDYKAVQNYVKSLGLESDVILPGYMKNPYKWIRKASVCVLSSKTEGFSNSVIEAMAIGTPMLVTDYHTGAREVSCNNKNCIMTKCGDANEMSYWLKRMIEDEELRNNLTRNAMEFVMQFSYPEYKKNVTNFLSDIVRE